jgi:hypothetical protein
MGAAMVALQGDTLGYANTMANAAVANQQMVTDFGNLKKGVLDLKTGELDYHNAAAAPVLRDLQQMQTAGEQAAEATYQHEVKTKGLTQASKDAAAVFRNDTRNALIAEASQLGLTHTQAKKLADTYFNWPKKARTEIETLGQDRVTSILSNILIQLEKLNGTYTPTITVNDYASNTLTSIQRQMTNINGTVSTVTVRYSTQGIQAGALGRGPQADQGAGGSKPVTPAHGMVLDFYAGGGIRERHAAQIAPAGAMRIWAEPETGGEAYIPLSPSKRSRSRSIAALTVARLGGQARFFETGGFTGVTGGSGGGGGGGSGGGSGSGGGGGGGSGPGGGQTAAEKKAAADLKEWWKTITPLAHQLGNELGYLAKQKTLLALAKWDTNDIEQRMQQYTQTVQGLRQAKVISHATMVDWNNDNRALNAALKTRDYYAGRTAAWRSQLSQDTQAKAQYKAQVSGGFQGAFDIGTSGQGYAYGIQSSLKTQVANTQKYLGLINKAKSLGLDSRLVAQFLSEGSQGEANLEAIVNAGKGFIAGINKDYSTLVNTSNQLGGMAANDKYNATIARDNAKISYYAGKTADAQAVVTQDLRNIRNDLKAINKTLQTAETRHRTNGRG